MIDYKSTVQKFKSNFVKFEAKARELEKQLAKQSACCELLYYPTLDDHVIEFHYPSLYTEKDIEEMLDDLLYDGLNAEEYMFFHYLRKYQNDNEYHESTDVILEALENFPKEHLTADDIQKAVEDFRITMFAQNEN